MIPAITLSNVTIAYNQIPLLYNVSATMPANKLSAIIGSNGAGKTTLIKSILGIIKPIAGRIIIYGKSVTSQRHAIAYIAQRASVDWDFPATVFDVVLMGCYGKLGWFSRPGKKEHDAVWHNLEQVGMVAHAHTPIYQLSGGQQQRIFLARALMQDAQLYLFDEPFNGIDLETEQLIISLLKKMVLQGKTVIVVHHDLHTLPYYFNWVVLLQEKNIQSASIGDALHWPLVARFNNNLNYNLIEF
jgi:manganese/zinc/iron transport system ATP- binding protein